MSVKFVWLFAALAALAVARQSLQAFSLQLNAPVRRGRLADRRARAASQLEDPEDIEVPDAVQAAEAEFEAQAEAEEEADELEAEEEAEAQQEENDQLLEDFFVDESGEVGEESSAEEDFEEPEEEEEEPEELDVEFETQAIRDSIEDVSWVMDEKIRVMSACINSAFNDDPLVDADSVEEECVGFNFQILYFSYNESLRRAKGIYFEMFKRKLAMLDEAYASETLYFLDTLEMFIKKDFNLAETLELTKQTSHFHVQPKFFELLVEIAEKELQALSSLHQALKAARIELEDLFAERVREQNLLLGQVDEEKESLETVVEDDLFDAGEPEVEEVEGLDEFLQGLENQVFQEEKEETSESPDLDYPEEGGEEQSDEMLGDLVDEEAPQAEEANDSAAENEAAAASEADNEEKKKH